MDLAQLITVFAIVATNLGTVIFLHCHLDNRLEKKIDENRRETNDILKAIQEEMKSFHTRLLIIEERNRK